MPDHIHILIPEDGTIALAGIIAAFSREFRIGNGTWLPIDTPEAIPNQKHLWRNVRYIALNPCRDRLCKDPLEWLWSTHRDVMSAATDPWVTADRLSNALAMPLASFPARHHGYVSGDPSVAVQGTPVPRPAAASEFPNVPLMTIVAAARAATRGAADSHQRSGDTRNLTIWLSRHQGWKSTSQLAKLTGAAERTVREIAAKPDPRLMRAGLLCLGDARLRA